MFQGRKMKGEGYEEGQGEFVCPHKGMEYCDVTANENTHCLQKEFYQIGISAFCLKINISNTYKPTQNGEKKSAAVYKSVHIDKEKN